MKNQELAQDMLCLRENYRNDRFQWNRCFEETGIMGAGSVVDLTCDLNCTATVMRKLSTL